MENIQIFNNAEFGQVRTIEEDGKVLFCGSDVARALGYRIPSKAVNTHCKGVSKMEVPTNGGKQQMNFITEGDLYRLIVNSKLPTAEKFESWVFDEVLPTIRQTGSYGKSSSDLNLELITRAMTETMVNIIPILVDEISQNNRREILEKERTIEILQEEKMNLKTRRRGGFSKVETLPQWLFDEVFKMLLEEYSYREIVDFCESNGYLLSQMSVCRFAKRFDSM